MMLRTYLYVFGLGGRYHVSMTIESESCLRATEGTSMIKYENCDHISGLEPRTEGKKSIVPGIILKITV